MDKELILIDREKKYEIIKSYLDKGDVVTLKANIPGLDKHIKESNILLNLFNQKLLKLNPIESYKIDGKSGLLYLYIYNKGIVDKNTLINIENSKLGRLVDIDLYVKEKSISRGEMRRCFICNDYAFNCIRGNKHSYEEVINYFKSTILDSTCEIIYDLIEKSMLEELNLDPKFGLVTPTSSGSHKDMTYLNMIKGKDVIIKYFIEMFKYAYSSDLSFKEIFNYVRNIGVKAENEMLSVNNGINTYKGLIFDLGLIVTALGIKLSRDTLLSLSDIIKEMTVGITSELKSVNTSGAKAYRDCNMLGARGEASDGFKIVFDTVLKFDLNSYESKISALAYIIYNSNDTVLYKRSGSIEEYEKVKLMFKDFNYSDENVNKITDESVKKYLSYGGSADLLVCSVFIKYIRETFDFPKI